MPRPRPRDDTYWRFTYPSLNKAQLHMRLVSIGSLIGGNVTRNVLVQGLRQYDFGQLEYQRCSDDEIRKFALDQGIVNPNDFATSRTALLTKLQKANESRTFGRSASCHRNSAITAEPLRSPTDPPLTRVSRLLRAEALPIFYKACTFHLIAKEVSAQHLDFEPGCRSFLIASGDRKLGMMRDLSIDFVVGARGPKCHATTARINISDAGDTYCVCVSDPLVKNRSKAWMAELKGRISEHIERTLDKTRDTNAKIRLRTKDALSIVNGVFHGQLFYSEFFPNGPLR